MRPESAFAHFTLGRICEVNGDVESAVACYQRALALDPGEVRARGHLGTILLTVRHQPVEALAQFEAILKTAPTMAGAHYGKGLVLFDEGKPNEAMAAFRRALEYEPDNYRTHHALALTLNKQGNLSEALAEARQAATLAADEPEEQLLLGGAWASMASWTKRLRFSSACSPSPAGSRPGNWPTPTAASGSLAVRKRTTRPP